MKSRKEWRSFYLCCFYLTLILNILGNIDNITNTASTAYSATDMSSDDDAECIDLAAETYDIIRTIQDPEKVQTLEDLEVVQEDLIIVRKLKNGNAFHIRIEFVPTVPHCSLASLIGLCIRVKLQENLMCNYKLDINIKSDSHNTGPEISKQINDKERTAAAMENPELIKIVKQCIKEME